MQASSKAPWPIISPRRTKPGSSVELAVVQADLQIGPRSGVYPAVPGWPRRLFTSRGERSRRACGGDQKRTRLTPCRMSLGRLRARPARDHDEPRRSLRPPGVATDRGGEQFLAMREDPRRHPVRQPVARRPSPSVMRATKRLLSETSSAAASFERRAWTLRGNRNRSWPE
jgi:hypothetical protein